MRNAGQRSLLHRYVGRRAGSVRRLRSVHQNDGEKERLGQLKEHIGNPIRYHNSMRGCPTDSLVFIYDAFI